MPQKQFCTKEDTPWPLHSKFVSHNTLPINRHCYLVTQWTTLTVDVTQ